MFLNSQELTQFQQKYNYLKKLVKTTVSVFPVIHNL